MNVIGPDGIPLPPRQDGTGPNRTGRDRKERKLLRDQTGRDQTGWDGTGSRRNGWLINSLNYFSNSHLYLDIIFVPLLLVIDG